MKKKGATLAAIGRALGVSRERARQICQTIEEKYGKIACQYLTVTEAADRLGVVRNNIYLLLKRGKIPVVFQRSGWRYLFRPEDIASLMEKICAPGTCAVCGKIFVRKTFQRLVTCSHHCSRKWQWLCQRGVLGRERKRKILAVAPSEQSLRGWVRALWRQLQKRSPSSGEERWLTFGEAVRLSGLSKQSIIWLRMRKIIAVRSHPTKKWGVRGTPERLYAASQVQLAGRIYRQWLRRRPVP